MKRNGMTYIAFIPSIPTSTHASTHVAILIGINILVSSCHFIDFYGHLLFIWQRDSRKSSVLNSKAFIKRTLPWICKCTIKVILSTIPYSGHTAQPGLQWILTSHNFPWESIADREILSSYSALLFLLKIRNR